MKRILFLLGPNLNMVGIRDTGTYGTETAASINEQVKAWAQELGAELEIYQSNHEGDLIDWIQEANDGMSAALPLNGDASLNDVKGIVINAGGYSHTSVAIRDAVEESDVPVVEVHISDIRTREPFRQVSLLTDVCAHNIIGKGTDGYRLGVEWILNTVKR